MLACVRARQQLPSDQNIPFAVTTCSLAPAGMSPHAMKPQPDLALLSAAGRHCHWSGLDAVFKAAVCSAPGGNLKRSPRLLCSAAETWLTSCVAPCSDRCLLWQQRRLLPALQGDGQLRHPVHLQPAEHHPGDLEPAVPAGCPAAGRRAVHDQHGAGRHGADGQHG